MSVFMICTASERIIFDVNNQNYASSQVVDTAVLNAYLCIGFRGSDEPIIYDETLQALVIKQGGVVHIHVSEAHLDTLKCYFAGNAYGFNTNTGNPGVFSSGSNDYTSIKLTTRQAECRLQRIEMVYTPFVRPHTPTNVSLQSDAPCTLTATWSSDDDDATYHAWIQTVDNTQWSETFDFNTVTGGNDDQWSGNIASRTNFTSELEWTGENLYGANGCLRVGKSTACGTLTSPAFDCSVGTLSLRAGAWSGDSDSMRIAITSGMLTHDRHSGQQIVVPISRAQWSTLQIDIADAHNASLTFSGYKASNSRFFIDDISVEGRVITMLVDSVTSSTGLTLNDVPGNTSYTLYVTTSSVQPWGTTLVSDTISSRPVYVQAATDAIGETQTMPDFSVNGNIINNPLGMTLIVTDISGRMLMRTDSRRINTDGLPGGVYVITSRSGAMRFVKR